MERAKGFILSSYAQSETLVRANSLQTAHGERGRAVAQCVYNFIAASYNDILSLVNGKCLSLRNFHLCPFIHSTIYQIRYQASINQCITYHLVRLTSLSDVPLCVSLCVPVCVSLLLSLRGRENATRWASWLFTVSLNWLCVALKGDYLWPRERGREGERWREESQSRRQRHSHGRAVLW